MNQKLKLLQFRSVLSAESSSNRGCLSKYIIIVTDDKKIYNYTRYLNKDKFMKKNNIPSEYLSEGKQLTNKQYEMVLKFIEENIIGQKFNCIPTRDSYNKVTGNYYGMNFIIYNDQGTIANNSIYTKTAKFLKEIGEN